MNLKIDSDKIMERRLLWELEGHTSWWGTCVGGGGAAACG